MKLFSPIDYAAVVIYLLAVAALGASFYRRKTTAQEYFLGGRAMSWLPVGISIIAADLSAITVMGAPAWSFKNNLQLIWLAVAFPLIAPLAIKVFVPFYANLNLYTAYEYLERRFNVRVRLLCSLLFQALRGWHVAVAIYGPGLVINMVTGLPQWQCVLLMGCFTTIYTTMGGMKAVIWTDVIQFVTVVSGIALICIIAVSHVPGGLGGAFATANAAGKLDIFDFSFRPEQLTNVWACLIGGAVLALAPLTTDQAILQRLFTTKSQQDCKRSVLVQAVLVIPIVGSLHLTGLALYAFYQYNPERLQGLANTDAVLPYFVVRELPTGLSGLVIAAIFAASMAVMSAGVNALSTATTVDIYQRLWRPGRRPEEYARVGRTLTALWGLAVTLAALTAGKAGDLAVAYTRVSSVIAGPMLGLFLLGTMTRRATGAGVLAGTAAGALAVAAAIVWTRWSFFLHGPLGVVVTVAAGYAASLFTAPPSRDQVQGLVMGQGRAGQAADGA